MNICSIESCDRKVSAKGWCKKHYERNRKYGSPDDGPGTRDPFIRFEMYTDKQPDGCWRWTAELRNGYPRFRVNYKMVSAHRWSHEQFVGPIPEKYEVDHKCRNTWCVNPEHLEAVTGAENKRRSVRMASHSRGPGDPFARFWARISVQRDGCWNWLGTVDEDGYGKFTVSSKPWRVHRWSAQYVGGMTITGLDIDHTCLNRACVNPYHLEPVTTATNNQRMIPRRGR